MSDMTARPISDYIGTTSHMTELDSASGSAVAASRPTVEVIASTLVMSVCIAATIFGNVLVVLSVFTYIRRPARLFTSRSI